MVDERRWPNQPFWHSQFVHIRRLPVPVAIFVFLVVLVFSLIDTISLEDMTGTAISETKNRIHMHVLAHRDYPADLTRLPEREGYMNRTTDGWGRPLVYELDQAGVISLTSLGQDGELGGTGDDQDVTLRFRTRNDDGTLNIDDDLWLIHSEVHDSQ